ncbi:GNAT family N-acetyltransferase [Hymenobacter sp. BT491]|uniref:GNAT family N-acetyltransferase n=1 Tax=Hymenobacter sp. BT491 TaxID=2766779 RepID=UPI001653EC14|nr:GNAT family N-acetyltransferase [Hymenobacter sp. BT491]MBC6992461.1 GNAT family N-acetyltransferase [Hymenobacter sp. BT491]
MKPITIKRVTLLDVDRLQQIGQQTFFETFAASNSEQNMKTYLEEGFSIKKLTTELQEPNSEFYVAELANTVIGYLKLNTGPAQTERQADNAFEIERIYVLQAFHGKKVGQLLYEKALQLATHAQANYVWLGVWEENSRAIRFYQKNGFVAFDKHIFRLGDEDQTDILMKLPLSGNR